MATQQRYPSAPKFSVGGRGTSVVITASRKGAEREHLLDLTGLTSDEYDPHSRTKSLHRVSALH